MELTVTQNIALYAAQHGLSRRRVDFFRDIYAARTSRDPVLRRMAFFGVSLVPQFRRRSRRWIGNR